MPEINRICSVPAGPICYILATEVSREEKSACICLLYVLLVWLGLIQETKLGAEGETLVWQSKPAWGGLANQLSFTYFMELFGGKACSRRVCNACILTFLNDSAAFQVLYLFGSVWEAFFEAASNNILKDLSLASFVRLKSPSWGIKIGSQVVFGMFPLF